MHRTESVVFLSLVLDLFAFTIPLPLFPRLIEWYTLRESSDPSGFLSRTLQSISFIRSIFYKSSVNSQRWDVILLGGLMGSVFSTLQFLVSPKIGSLSDKYGRKRILLISMIGNILSAIVWIQSTTFASYMLSRVIGGLSEGNVQLAIAILSDITTVANRSKALAHVGIAFAVCFCIGPPIGAYFASRPLPHSLDSWGLELNIYVVPAFLSLVLLVVETIFLLAFLPETRAKSSAEKEKPSSATLSTPLSRHVSGKGNSTCSDDINRAPKANVDERLTTLKTLRWQHFLFLGIFSGMEFTLTFLTFDLLDWNNRQNGVLIGSIGVLSALLQGGYVRRSMSKVGEGVMARRGVPALAMKLLQGGAVCLAFTSATVVNALTAYASLQCDEGGFDDVTGKPKEEHPQLAKGRALGQFRSSGQLGRAVGPLLACASYWTFGPSVTYAVSALAMFAISTNMRSVAVKRSL
ncbi:Major facilitator superfamily domain-containing protein 10 [Termitomyces sp. J132]|nr:Major facilitator superfamily domain-containing protein 10 [Termitomyces sp. J132]